MGEEVNEEWGETKTHASNAVEHGKNLMDELSDFGTKDFDATRAANEATGLIDDVTAIQACKKGQVACDKISVGCEAVAPFRATALKGLKILKSNLGETVKEMVKKSHHPLTPIRPLPYP